ncbi:pyridoxal phosphate-dependent aminotransferase [Candidatus Babeliales bacterium]|nr:pyridoxal phosphate-dependent aminotransferase [Candidatus Babeliales bacterium]MCF7899548.1 pyridoxal phosphate-dependent aminotransferase [Candidatus Babeliales bacterium]
MLNLPLSAIKRIENIVINDEKYISLSQGALKINGIPQQIKNHLKKILDTTQTDFYQSAWGIMPLREKIAQVINQKNNTNILAKQILVTHGCTGGLASSFTTILEPGDEVLIPEPAYLAYSSITKIARAKPVFVSCVSDNKNKFWDLDIEKIKAAKTSKTKILVFSNPWNPLGLVVNKDIILDLLDWCSKNQIYMIMDEAYKDYVFSDNFESCTNLINQSEWLIEANTFSKNFGMSGWRIGYLIVPEKLCIAIGQTQDAMLNCPNIPAQYAAIYALDHPEIIQNFNTIIKNNLEMTKQELEPLVKENIFEYQNPDGGFYIFLKTQFKDSTKLCSNILNHAKVSLIPGGYFGQSGESFARLCFAREPQILKEGLDRIKNFLK